MPDITLRATSREDFCFQAHSRFGAAFLDHVFSFINHDLTWADAEDIVAYAKAEHLVVARRAVR